MSRGKITSGDFNIQLFLDLSNREFLFIQDNYTN